MNTNQGEGAMIRADEMDEAERIEAWTDMPGVPPPTDEELEAMSLIEYHDTWQARQEWLNDGWSLLGSY